MTQQGPIDRGVLSVRFFDIHLAELVAWGCEAKTRIVKLRWPPPFTGASTLRLGFDVIRGSSGTVFRIRPVDDAEAAILKAYEEAIAASDAAYSKRESVR